MDAREQRFWKRVADPDEAGCRIWDGAPNNSGYGTVVFKGMRTTAHRIAYMLTVGPVDAGQVVMHRCDVPLCCNPEHLLIGTQRDNIADMDRKGRRGDCRNFGESHGRSKLATCQVEEIKRLYANRVMSQDALAAHFGIAQSQVGRIVRGENRVHG